MYYKKALILFALIAATQSYVLQDERDFEQQFQKQLADEKHYFENVHRQEQPQAIFIQYDEPIQPDVLADTHQRQKRQDRGSRGSVTATVDRSKQTGTNVNIEAQARLWQSRNRQSTLDGNANYQRNFGGQFGTGRPNYGVGLNFRHRF